MIAQFVGRLRLGLATTAVLRSCSHVRSAGWISVYLCGINVANSVQLFGSR